MTMAKTTDVRVHIVTASTGKTTKKRTYQKPGSALSFAAKASRVTGVREAMIFTGKGKVATLIARDGKFWTPVEKDRPAIEIALPKAHLMREMQAEAITQLPIVPQATPKPEGKTKPLKRCGCALGTMLAFGGIISGVAVICCRWAPFNWNLRLYPRKIKENEND